jgi:hypothetical protein
MGSLQSRAPPSGRPLPSSSIASRPTRRRPCRLGSPRMTMHYTPTYSSGNHGLGRCDPCQVLLRVHLGHLGGQVGRISLRQFGHAIHAGGFEQLGVLATDSPKSKEVGMVDPPRNPIGTDAGRRGKRLPLLGRATRSQQRLDAGDPNLAKLHLHGRPHAFDITDRPRAVPSAAGNWVADVQKDWLSSHVRVAMPRSVTV